MIIFKRPDLILSQPAGEPRVTLKNITTASLFFAGLFSVTSASAQDYRQQFPQVETSSPYGVDLQTGQFIEQGTEFTIGPLSVDHYIRSREGIGGPGFSDPSPFATALHGNGNITTSPGAGGSTDTIATVKMGALKLRFNVLSSGAFFPLDSANTGWKMVTSGSTWVLTNKSGDTYNFSTHPGISSYGRLLTSKTSANGHKLSYTYDSTGKLRTVKSNRGYAVVLDYSGNNVIACGYNLTVTQVSTSSTCASSTMKVTYARDSLQRITAITRTDGSVVNIQYAPQTNNRHSPTCVTLPNSSTCAITNVYFTNFPSSLKVDMVIQQTTAAGDVWKYEHIPIENFPGDYDPAFGEIRRNYSIMVPPGSVLTGPGNTTATFGNGFTESLATPDGTTSHQYSSLGAFAILMGGGTSGTWTGPHYYSVYPSKITYPEGNSIYFTRDWADNVTGRADIAKPGSGLANNTTTWTYPTSYQWSSPTICAAANVLCDKPTKVTDPNGNETDYTYSSVHGGVSTETSPAVNGVRPQKRYNYIQRNAMIKSGSGYVAMQPPIWVLAAEEYCKTTAGVGSGCAGGNADEMRTTYDYGPTTGPNNLLLRGTVADSTGLALRTCYKYDQYGRKIAETQPKGTGSTCP